MSPLAEKIYNEEFQRLGRITNMKKTMAHDGEIFATYMRWYTHFEQLKLFLSPREATIFAYSISVSSECLICSTYFRKWLIENQCNPEKMVYTSKEEELKRLGKICIDYIQSQKHITEIREILSIYNAQQKVQLIGFAGLMIATNLFNNVLNIPLDDELTQYL